ALREVVEHRDPVGGLGRVVVGDEEPAGADAHALGLQEGLGHQEIRGRVRLPGRRVVLADPRFAEAQLVGPAELLEIPAVAVVEAALRRVRGHREEAVVHGGASVGARMAAAYTPIYFAAHKSGRTRLTFYGVGAPLMKTARLL